MISVQKIFFFLLFINGIAVLTFFTASFSYQSSPSSLKVDSTKTFLVKGDSSTYETQEEEIEELRKQLKEINEILKDTQKELKKAQEKIDTNKNKKVLRKNKDEPRSPFKAIIKTTNYDGQFTRDTNPFYLLGAYPTPAFPKPYEEGFEKLKYDEINYGLFNDDDYCEKVDYYNLARPFNIFERKNFLTDYARDTVPRQDIIPKIGRNVMNHFSKYNKEEPLTERTFHLSTRITHFFINSDAFHKHHEIGKNFLCATQLYNHIPGQRALIRKDDLVESVDRHSKKFESNSTCFNKEMFFPLSYRLYKQEECDAFLNKINSKKYLDSLEQEPVQYLIKMGHGSHAGEGVYLLDKNQTEWLNEKYDFGVKCGEIDEAWIAQKYITNPLLLDIGNKFDFRVFMVIASTNPLIVYYHDGILRASLSPYDKFSHEKGKHLTNYHLAKPIIEAAKTNKVYGMTEKELTDYHLWNFQELEQYLIESGKVTDPNWLENHLRPQFRKAMIHIVKMSSEFFWKQSNVYGLYGLDFMLDDNMNLWFIEANPNPQLKSINNAEFDEVLFSVVEGLFEISFNLYRSRMKRAFGLVQRLREAEALGTVDYSKWREEYQEIIKNKLEPEYQLNKTNHFTLVMDESLPGSEAYFNNIDPECAEFFPH